MAVKTSNPVAQAILDKVEHEGNLARNFGYKPVTAQIGTSSSGEQQLEIDYPEFPVTLPFSQLDRVARSVSQPSWALLGRPGVFETAEVIVKKATSPLRIEDERNGTNSVLMKFDIDAHKIEVRVEPDVKRKKIRGYFVKVPATFSKFLESSLGRVFTVRGPDEFSMMGDYRLDYLEQNLGRMKYPAPVMTASRGQGPTP